MKLHHKILVGTAAVGLAVASTLLLPNASCHILNNLPDAKCTPGQTVPVDLQTLCTAGYTATVRNVPESEKQAVLKEYGYSKNPGEIDHLVSLELAGSNDITNLWPEAGKIPNPKDAIENRLHADVCSGKLTLDYAQHCIATNWQKCY